MLAPRVSKVHVYIAANFRKWNNSSRRYFLLSHFRCCFLSFCHHYFSRFFFFSGGGLICHDSVAVSAHRLSDCSVYVHISQWICWSFNSIEKDISLFQLHTQLQTIVNKDVFSLPMSTVLQDVVISFLTLSIKYYIFLISDYDSHKEKVIFNYIKGSRYVSS